MIFQQTEQRKNHVIRQDNMCEFLLRNVGQQP